MKRSIKYIVAVALLGAAAGLYAFAQSSPGEVDMARVVEPAKAAQYVDVNVGRTLISLAARFVEKQQPETAELLRSVHLVRVNVVGVTDENREELQKRIGELRSQLDKQGWQRIVAVQEKNGEDVGVYLKTRGNDAVEGLFVSVLDGKKEAVLVNIVGDIRPEQVMALGEALGIDAVKQAGAAVKK
jgi:ATP sulfurylase